MLNTEFPWRQMEAVGAVTGSYHQMALPPPLVGLSILTCCCAGHNGECCQRFVADVVTVDQEAS